MHVDVVVMILNANKAHVIPMPAMKGNNMEYAYIKYLGVQFSETDDWDIHVKLVILNQMIAAALLSKKIQPKGTIQPILQSCAPNVVGKKQHNHLAAVMTFGCKDLPL
jgi:hypothetical protein